MRFTVCEKYFKCASLTQRKIPTRWRKKILSGCTQRRHVSIVASPAGSHKPNGRSSAAFKCYILNQTFVCGMLGFGAMLWVYSPALVNLVSSPNHYLHNAAFCLVLRCWGATLITAGPLVSAASSLDLEDMLNYVNISGLNWLAIATVELLWFLHRTTWGNTGVELFIIMQVMPLSMLYIWGRAIQYCSQTLSDMYVNVLNLKR